MNIFFSSYARKFIAENNDTNVEDSFLLDIVKKVSQINPLPLQNVFFFRVNTIE